MSETHPPRFLIKMPVSVGKRLTAKPLQLAGNTLQLRLLCPNEELGRQPGAAPGPRWYVAEMAPGAATVAELWEMAHQALGPKGALTDSPEVYLEPDLYHAWKYDNPVQAAGFGASPGETCKYNDQLEDLPRVLKNGNTEFGWHLRNDFSQLKQARDQVAQAGPARVRLAILDVGFDFSHRTRPKHLREDLQRNFVDDGQSPADASDHYVAGLFNNPGHGTATLGLLAGGILSGMVPEVANTNDYLGGAPLAEIIPVRIANSVILLRTSAFVEALDYLIAPNGDASQRADVVSMSMGGWASKAWAEVVNRAYEAGICLVTAAGNNFIGTPQSIVYPARFQRVIAACGVMADGQPYIRDHVPLLRMAGNYGPNSKMDTALAAYTPNMPWAEINCPNIIDMCGCGTSAATPQIAAAAALWLQKYKDQLHYAHPWEVVEAVRQALFSSANKNSPESHKYFGQGILRAAAALQVQPAAKLEKTPADDASLAFLRVLMGVGLAASASQDEMLAVEALQLLQREAQLEKTISDPDLPAEQIPEQECKDFLEAAIASELSSPTLKEYLKGAYTKRFGASSPGVGTEASSGWSLTDQEVAAPPPVYRQLRSYAFDPELSTRLETAQINEAVLEIPWEKDLQPGPAGEYVEVIDHDPASGCFYAPVDLNDPPLLATAGLAPSEGNPKFHQQMVYAVAMRTIHNFELALGRKALWSPRMRNKDDREYVQKLRIYPHALRERNAFYQPDMKALLFGYFPATEADPGQQYPGGMVFTCLSHDIVAHETTHALLDGMHRNFIRPDNEDQLAFHEAFADIVALFQHFAMPEVLRHQIGKTRGDLRARNMLGELAQQFGQASGMRGALRSAIGKTDPETGQWSPLEPDPARYLTEIEPHARGSLLVAAVFDAFLSIYETRIADLLRLATAGTGILPNGAIHPDLVGRLSDEAAKVAGHVLTMCVRALDYCPPVDLTFGDYLRALITADFDIIPDDSLGYRVAFVEAFRRRGIYPRDLRSLSIDALRWRPAGADQSENLLRPVFSQLRDFANRFFNIDSRQEMFERSRDWRKRVHAYLTKYFQSLDKSQRQRVMSVLGLDLTTGREHFEVHALRIANKQGPDTTPIRPQILLTLVQDRQVPGDPAGGGAPIRFNGGCTVIADKRSAQVKYYVSKNILSPGRLARQQAFNHRLDRPLADLYFGAGPLAGLAQRFAMLHAEKEVY
jgi:hypothetical protein